MCATPRRTSAPGGTRKDTGQTGRGNWNGAVPGTACSIGSPRTPSGSSAAGARRVRHIKGRRQRSDALREELKNHVSKKIGALAKPDDILFSADLPKTRSGKIMRRLLKDIAEGRALGDTTTLADPAVVAKLRDQYESQET